MTGWRAGDLPLLAEATPAQLYTLGWVPQVYAQLHFIVNSHDFKNTMSQDGQAQLLKALSGRKEKLLDAVSNRTWAVLG